MSMGFPALLYIFIGGLLMLNVIASSRSIYCRRPVYSAAAGEMPALRDATIPKALKMSEVDSKPLPRHLSGALSMPFGCVPLR